MENQKETLVLIETGMGDIKVKLYNDTPKHRDNFIKLVKEGAYDGTLFHRVIKDFMGVIPIQKMLRQGNNSAQAMWDIPFRQSSYIRSTSTKRAYWRQHVRAIR